MTERMRKKRIARLKKWVAALRSGKYKQATGALCVEKRYCCLGVAGKISNISLSLKRVGEEDPYVRINAHYGLGENQDVLVHMNDRKRASFPRIASWIEKNLIKAKRPTGAPQEEEEW